MAIPTRATPSPLVLGLVLLIGGLACESSSDSPRDAGIEDGGRRDPDGGDAAATDASEPDGNVLDAGDGDSSVDELGEPDGGDGGPAEPGETLSLASYCEQVAALYYEYLQQCYGTEPYPESLREERVEEYRARCMQVEGAIEAERVAFDEEQAHACVELLEVGGCARQFEGLCEGVFRGLLELGDDCYIEETLIFSVGVSACGEGFCDEGDACPGTCRALPERGEECEESRCRAEDYCDGDGICRARSGPGEDCVEGYECESGLLCTDVEDDRLCQRPVLREGAACSESAPCGGVTACIDGECTFARSLGQVCSLHSQCPDGARCILQECAEPGASGDRCVGDRDCEAGLLCNTALTEPECVGLPEVGEPCLRERCVAGASCRYDVDDGAGTCRAQVGEGDSCMVGVIRDDNRCQEGLHCIEEGTCEPPGDLGDPCGTLSAESCVGGLWCSRQTHTCQMPAAQGEPCNPYWLSTCEGGLGCACGVDDLELCFAYVREHQATDTCHPLVDGAGDCFRTAECASKTCVADFEGPSDVPGTCSEPDPVCLP